MNIIRVVEYAYLQRTHESLLAFIFEVSAQSSCDGQKRLKHQQAVLSHNTFDLALFRYLNPNSSTPPQPLRLSPELHMQKHPKHEQAITKSFQPFYEPQTL